MDYKKKYLKYKTKYLVEKTMMDIKQNTLNTLKQMKGGTNDSGYTSEQMKGGANDSEYTSEQIIAQILADTHRTTAQINDLTTGLKVGHNLVIFIYSPLCHYCKEYYNSYKELEGKVNKNTSIICHNAAENNPLYYNATGVPTLLLVKKEKEDHITKEELKEIYNIDSILEVINSV